MKREIKFRGKYKGEWVYGSLVQGKAKDSVVCQIEHVDYDDHHVWDVDPDSVGQFTGLLDKGKKEIYEADIVLHGNDKFKIIFSNGAFKAERIIKSVGYPNVLGFGTWSKQTEIIGNTTDNPELLK